MLNTREKEEIIFLTSYIKDNTTSAERYKSFIKEFLSKGYPVKIIEFDYPIVGNLGKAHETKNTDELEPYIANNLYRLKSDLDFFQKLIFSLFRSNFVFLAKSLHLIYQLFFHRDIYYPGKKSINKNPETKNGYIIVSGGPFGLFSYAEKISKELDYKLVLDYRDPWTFGYSPLEGNSWVYKLKNKFNRVTEYYLLKRASLVTTVSDTLKGYYPDGFQSKVYNIPNGSNYNWMESDVKELKTFNILYCGTVYNEQLIDDVFFKTLNAFLTNKDPSTIKMQFLGSYYNQEIKNKLERFNLLEITEITKRLKRDDLKSYLSSASVLLHLRYGDKSGVITSKQADYLALQKPILLPVSDNGDIAESITKNNAGYVCNTVEENVAVLEALYSKFLKGESLTIPQSEEMLRKNSRKYIAKEFVDLVLKS